ncbi:type II/IV secretion system ATPase subunit [Candidatus Bathyarchaeota archaeon A05DMB-2]|jgi:flagellar protein FlaI|nr:type II/IV secretion system ATPase subunit [Candidatus Bathyarchaeota archaeon A05DMB-2]
MPFGKKKKEEMEEEEKISEEEIIGYLGIQGCRVPEGYVQVESYPLKPPYSYAWIFQDESDGSYFYVVDELTMSREERDAYKRLKNILEYELKAPRSDETLAESFHRQLPGIIEEHQKALEGIDQIGLRKIRHYLERDLIGYGKIDALICDPFIEDISCLGINKPVYLWHRKYENARTNIIFTDEEELDDFITRIVHRQGKHVSIAHPIVDVTLPGKHRLAVSFGKETTPAGTSFTIRKFKEDPMTIVDLIMNETIDEAIGAYLWMLMESKMSVMIVGPTGAGKTTALNAIACLVRPDFKIISVEEVAEINLPQENWVSTIARPGFGGDSEGEVTLYDLIKSAVRHRPALILVGEIRGEEAYVLFQALATGHGGLCTMHAEDVESVMKRLTQPPMNIPQGILPLMNCVIVVKQVETPGFIALDKKVSSRKFVRVSEIDSNGAINDVFLWNPSAEAFQQKVDQSYLLNKIAKNLDVPLSVVIQELERRKHILLKMVEKNLRDFRSVHKALNSSLNVQDLEDQETVKEP